MTPAFPAPSGCLMQVRGPVEAEWPRCGICQAEPTGRGAGNWVEVGRVFSSGSPESWQELPVEVIQHLLVVALRWAEADAHDVEVPPPDMIARKNVLLKYQALPLSDVVSWAWAGLPRHESA